MQQAPSPAAAHRREEGLLQAVGRSAPDPGQKPGADIDATQRLGELPGAAPTTQSLTAYRRRPDLGREEFDESISSACHNNGHKILMGRMRTVAEGS